MTMQEIRDWCEARTGLRSRTLALEGRDDPWGDGGYYHHKLEFLPGGDTYEITDSARNGLAIYINGALAYARPAGNY